MVMHKMQVLEVLKNKNSSKFENVIFRFFDEISDFFRIFFLTFRVVWLLIGVIRGKIYVVWGGDAQNASSGSTKKQEFIEI